MVTYYSIPGKCQGSGAMGMGLGRPPKNPGHAKSGSELFPYLKKYAGAFPAFHLMLQPMDGF
jgi:hypothetical protein